MRKQIQTKGSLSRFFTLMGRRAIERETEAHSEKNEKKGRGCDKRETEKGEIYVCVCQ